MTTSNSQPPTLINESAAYGVMALLGLNRVLTTDHMGTLLRTRHQDVAKAAARLRAEDLIDSVPASNYPNRFWALTATGAEYVAGWPELRDRAAQPFEGYSDASLQAAHALSVTRTRMAFLNDARRRGHQHGPYDWATQVIHRTAEPGGRDRLIADALMYYALPSDASGQTYRAFLHLDRGLSGSARVAEALIPYGQFYGYRPHAGDQAAWRTFYARFPSVLFVLANVPADEVAHRVHDLRVMAASHPLVTPMSNDPDVALGVAVLEEIEQHGPGAPVWTPLSGPAEPRKAWWDL